MKHKLVLFVFLTLFSFYSMSQVKWIEFADLPTEFGNSKKPVLIFIHTNWCKICKMQEGTVFADDSIAKQLTEKFYLLKLNAEDENDISFFGRVYKGATFRNQHELAEYIGKGEKGLNFPTIVILNEKLELVYKNTGFVSKDEIRRLDYLKPQ